MLRIVEFAEMTKPNVKLLRIVLCDILMQKDEQDVMQIFQVNTGILRGKFLSSWLKHIVSNRTGR